MKTISSAAFLLFASLRLFAAGEYSPLVSSASVLLAPTDFFQVNIALITNALGSVGWTPGEGGLGGGSVTSVGAITSVNGLSFVGQPITSNGTLILTGTVGVGGGGTGATTAAAARANLGLGSAATNDVAAFTGGPLNGTNVWTGTNFFQGRLFVGVTDIATAFANLGSLYQAIDPDLTTLAGNNGSALTGLNGSSIASGTVAAARIDSVMATDAEVAAAFQPLDADLTSLAALNGSGLTNLNGSSISSGTVAAARIDSAMATDIEVALRQLGSQVLTNLAGLTGTAGQIITSTGSGFAMSNAPAGDVTLAGNNDFTGTNTFPKIVTPSLSATTFTVGGTNVMDEVARKANIADLTNGLSSIQVNGTSGGTNVVNGTNTTASLAGGQIKVSLNPDITVSSVTAPTLVVTGSTTLSNLTAPGAIVGTQPPGTSNTLAASTAFAMAAAAAAAGTTAIARTNYYASPNGLAGNTGLTPESPWPLQTALSALGPGITVIVGDGYYTNSTGYSIYNHPGSASNWAIVRAANKWKAVITGNTSGYQLNVVNDVFQSQYLTIDGLCLSNCPTASYSLNLNTALATVKNCWVVNHAGQGIGASSQGTYDIVLDGNLIERCGRGTNSTGYGVYISGPRQIVRNNVFRNNGGYGIHSYTSYSNNICWDSRFYNNLTYGHTNHFGATIYGSAGENPGAWSSPGTNYIYNNTFLDGLELVAGTAYVTNNFVFPNVAHPTVPIYGSSSHPTTALNNYNLSSERFDTGAYYTQGANDVITNYFGFVNTGAGLYWLKSDSPLRNVAAPAVFGASNFWGVARSSVTDIGAFQYDPNLEADTRDLAANRPDYWATPSPEWLEIAATQSGSATDLVVTNVTTARLVVTGQTLHSVLPVTASSGTNVVLDFTFPFLTISATNNIALYQSTNRPASATNAAITTLFITGDTVDRVLTWNSSWKRIGTNITTIPSNKVVEVSCIAIGSAESGVKVVIGKEE